MFVSHYSKLEIVSMKSSQEFNIFLIAYFQMPSNTHRSLISPFLLYGLGRSPNFVDDVNIRIYPRS